MSGNSVDEWPLQLCPFHLSRKEAKLRHQSERWSQTIATFDRVLHSSRFQRRRDLTHAKGCDRYQMLAQQRVE